MPLGLSDDDVILVPHDAGWKEEFEKEKSILKKIEGVLRIEHCGSTSIPAIPSKPIMNICVAVASLNNLEALTEQMLAAGYVYKPSDFSDHELFIKREGDLSTHHVHFMAEDGLNWKKSLAFRDHLIANPDVAEEYASLKKRLAAEFPHDRRSYGEGKNPFIEKILKELL